MVNKHESLTHISIAYFKNCMPTNIFLIFFLVVEYGGLLEHWNFCLKHFWIWSIVWVLSLFNTLCASPYIINNWLDETNNLNVILLYNFLYILLIWTIILSLLFYNYNITDIYKQCNWSLRLSLPMSVRTRLIYTS